MKKTHQLFIILLMFFGSARLTHAQQLSSEELKVVSGKWKGTLTYTDYQDDQTQVTLQTSMEAVWTKDKLQLKYYYTEPSGEVIESGMEQLHPGKTVDTFYFEGKWKINELKQSEAGWTLHLSRKGKDNNQSAQIRKTIVYQQNQFEIIKEVMYLDGDAFFQRNAYQFTRQTDL